MEEILTDDIWQQANTLLPRGPRVACIAYVHNTGLTLKKGDVLICDASRYAITNGLTSARALHAYYKKGIEIYSSSSLHAKFVWTKTMVILGSANLSRNSATKLREAAVLTTSPVICGHTEVLKHAIQKKAISLTQKRIAGLLKIKVKRKFPARSLPRRKNLTKPGNRFWFMPTYEIPEWRYEENKKRMRKTYEAVAEVNKTDISNLEHVECGRDTKLTREIRNGDHLLCTFTNRKKTRTSMWLPIVILEKKKENKKTILFYDSSSDEEMSVSRFRGLCREQGYTNIFGRRMKEIPVADLNEIIKIFESTRS